LQVAARHGAHSYELAASAAPPRYFEQDGYEQRGRLLSSVVTVTDIAGDTFFSTQSKSSRNRS
jgi:hypothetical protein